MHQHTSTKLQEYVLFLHLCSWFVWFLSISMKALKRITQIIATLPLEALQVGFLPKPIPEPSLIKCHGFQACDQLNHVSRTYKNQKGKHMFSISKADKINIFCCNSGLFLFDFSTSHHFVVCPKVLSRLAACAAAEMARPGPTLPAWLEECSGNTSGRFAMEKIAPMGWGEEALSDVLSDIF